MDLVGIMDAIRDRDVKGMRMSSDDLLEIKFDNGTILLIEAVYDQRYETVNLSVKIFDAVNGWTT